MSTRQTIQADMVLNAVCQLADHPTADEVYDRIRQDYPHISRATVYRNLNRLASQGAIRKLAIPQGADRFDHISQKHYHIRCEKCGRLYDVKMDVIGDMIDRIKDKQGFKFNDCDIIFQGVCPQCLKEGTKHK